MKINEFHLQVLKGEKCPQCKSGTKLIPAKDFYDMVVNTDFVVVCRNYPNCKSYTHAFNGTTKPHGRLVIPATMRKRTKAYEKLHELTVIKSYMTEEEALKELSEHLGTPLEYTYPCYLNGKNCQRVETWCIKKMYHFLYKETGRFSVPMTSRNGKRKRITIIEQTSPYTSIVEFDEDEKRMEIETSKIFYYNPRK